MLIITALFIILPTIRSTVMAQDSDSGKLRQVEQTILAVNYDETYGNEFVEQGLIICKAYNELTYEEKISASEAVTLKYDEVMSRVAFVLQQSIDKIITAQQPMSELFQPIMELNKQVVQLQWNYQQKISNLDQFEQVRVDLREGYLNDEFIPNYYIRESIYVSEDDFLSYQQSVMPKEPVMPEEPVLEQSSVPTVRQNPPKLPQAPTSSANWVKPANSSQQTESSNTSSEVTSSEVTSSEVTSSEPTSSVASELTSSNETASTASTPNKTVPIKATEEQQQDSYQDINLTAIYVTALAGLLIAVALSCIIVWKSK